MESTQCADTLISWQDGKVGEGRGSSKGKLQFLQRSFVFYMSNISEYIIISHFCHLVSRLSIPEVIQSSLPPLPSQPGNYGGLRTQTWISYPSSPLVGVFEDMNVHPKLERHCRATPGFLGNMAMYYGTYLKDIWIFFLEWDFALELFICVYISMLIQFMSYIHS